MIIFSVTLCIKTQEPISKKQITSVQQMAKCCFPSGITVSDFVLSPPNSDVDMHIFDMHILCRLVRSSQYAIRTIKK